MRELGPRSNEGTRVLAPGCSLLPTPLQEHLYHLSLLACLRALRMREADPQSKTYSTSGILNTTSQQPQGRLVALQSEPDRLRSCASVLSPAGIFIEVFDGWST